MLHAWALKIDSSYAPGLTRPLADIDYSRETAGSMYNLQSLSGCRSLQELIRFYRYIIMNMNLNSKGLLSRSRFVFP